jgi:molecular chaperone HscB
MAAAMTDAFARLGLPRRFDLDAKAINSAHLKLAAAIHPDRAPDPIAAADLQRKAAELNDARRMLLDPERRADELLRGLGGPSKEADRSLPDGFLVEMMDVREAVEAARGDAAEAAKWEAWAVQKRRDYVDRVSGMFAALGEAPQAAAMAAIRKQLNAWRYIERLIEQQ